MTKHHITLLQITDTHILASPHDTLLGINTAHYFQAVVKQAFEKQSFDVVLLTGDLAQDACVASYNFIYDTLAPYQIPCLCLPGNHDDYDMMQQIFNTSTMHCHKQVLFNNWQLISLNSQIIGANGGYLTDDELAFLEQCLSEYPDHYAFIAMHHHCLKTGSAWMDSMIIKNNLQLLATLHAYPHVKIMVHGHIHQNLHIKTDGICVYGTPSTCFQFKPKSDTFELDNTSPGYRIITLYENGEHHSESIRLSESLHGLQQHIHGY